MENSFSLLVNVEGDASAFLERLAAEAKAEDQKHKRSTQQFVRTENGEAGKRGQGTGLRRYARNNGQLENGHGNQRSSGIVDGWRRNNGGGNDYQNHQGGASWRPGRNTGQQFGQGYGNQKSGGSVDGWKRNNGGGNGYKQGYGRGDGGFSGRGRGLVGAPNGNNGAGKNSQIVEGDQQGEIQEQGGDTDGDWEKVIKKQQNSSYRGGRGQNGRRNNGNGYWRNNSRPKEASGSSGNHSTNGDNDIGNFAAATQLSKDDVQDSSGKKVEEEQAEEARENIQEETKEERIARIEEEQERIRKEARRKAWEEEQKKMTLKQYENKLLEERKKTLEDLTTEERKVIPDKDFESMQLVRKKKEDSLFTNQDTENGKLKKKDTKVVKSMSIDEFLKPAKGENSNRGIQGRGHGEYQRGTSSQQATYHANGDRFPQTAGRKEYVANFGRPGGPAEGGNSRRGSFHGRGGGGHQEGTLSRQATDRANGDRFPQPAGGREHTTNSNGRGGRGGGGGRGGFARGSSADAADPTAVEVVDVPAIHDSTQFPHLGAPAVK